MLHVCVELDATSDRSAYLQVMLFLCPLRLAECSHVIDNLHIERNKADVSSHVKVCISSMFPFIYDVSIVYEQPSYVFVQSFQQTTNRAMTLLDKLLGFE